jgi:hypothetical protein
VVLLIAVGAVVWWRTAGNADGSGRVSAPDGLVVRVRQRDDLSHLSEGGHEPAVLLYRGCQPQDCDWRLVFRDGRQYLLHHVADESVAEQLTGLSPNGRIVAVPTDAGMVFRDLVAGTIQPGGPLAAYRGGTRRAWSDDGRWLVHYSSDDPGVMVDTVTGKRRKLPGGLGDVTIAGVTRDARLITVTPERTGREIRVSVSEVADVDRPDHRTVNISGVLKPRETLTGGRGSHIEAYASPDSSRIVVAVHRTDHADGERTTAVLLVDLTSGTVVKRHDLDSAATAVCGWDATGVHVLADRTGGGRAVIRWFDPLTGVERDRATVQGGLQNLSVRC